MSSLFMSFKLTLIGEFFISKLLVINGYKFGDLALNLFISLIIQLLP